MEEKLVIGKTYKLTDFRNFISKNYSENIVLASENQLKSTPFPTSFVNEADYKLIDYQLFLFML